MRRPPSALAGVASQASTACDLLQEAVCSSAMMQCAAVPEEFDSDTAASSPKSERFVSANRTDHETAPLSTKSERIVSAEGNEHAVAALSSCAGKHGFLTCSPQISRAEKFDDMLRLGCSESRNSLRELELENASRPGEWGAVAAARPLTKSERLARRRASLRAADDEEDAKGQKDRPNYRATYRATRSARARESRLKRESEQSASMTGEQNLWSARDRQESSESMDLLSPSSGASTGLLSPSRGVSVDVSSPPCGPSSADLGASSQLSKDSSSQGMLSKASSCEGALSSTCSPCFERSDSADEAVAERTATSEVKERSLPAAEDSPGGGPPSGSRMSAASGQDPSQSRPRSPRVSVRRITSASSGSSCAPDSSDWAA